MSRVADKVAPLVLQLAGVAASKKPPLVFERRLWADHFDQASIVGRAVCGLSVPPHRIRRNLRFRPVTSTARGPTKRRKYPPLLSATERGRPARSALRRGSTLPAQAPEATKRARCSTGNKRPLAAAWLLQHAAVQLAAEIALGQFFPCNSSQPSSRRLGGVVSGRRVQAALSEDLFFEKDCRTK